MIMLFTIFIILILLLTAIQFSAETAIHFVNVDKRKTGQKEPGKFFPGPKYFLRNTNTFFATLIFLRSFLFVLVFTILYKVNIFSINPILGISIIIVSLLFVLLVELLPQYLAKKYPGSILKTALPITAILYWTGFPFIKFISKLKRFVESYSKISETRIEQSYKRNEIKELLEESLEAGIVDETESNILNRIFELGDIRVYEVMRPRTEIVGADINSTVKEVLDIFIESGFSKMPIFEENLDNIKGFVSSYELFKRPENLKDIIRDVIYVPETKKCSDMLKEFSVKKTSFAIAVDEFGGTAGIITMEDLIEELLGEIKDEYDNDEEICRKVGDNSFIISGKVEIDYVNENFDLKIPEGEYSTIAGFITYFLGRIPVKNENVKVGSFRFTILKSTQTRIELVKVIASN